MTFPTTPLVITVELWISGAWTAITSDVQRRNEGESITITRGKQDIASQAQPSQLHLTLNNRLGKYSPRNPMGTYYGQIGRNTLIRVKVDASVRFVGEVSSWPAKWDMTGRDAYVPIEASGILRRLGQGDRPLQNSLKQYYLSTTPISYWPLDDGTDVTRGAVAKGTYNRSTFYRYRSTGAIFWNDGHLGSHLASTLKIEDLITSAGDDFMLGLCIGSSSAPDACAMDFLWRTDPTFSGNGTILGTTFHMTLMCEGSLFTSGGSQLDSWIVKFDTATDQISVVIEEDDLGATGTATFGPVTNTAVNDGMLHHVRLLLVVNGTGVDMTLYLDGVSILTGTNTTFTMRRVHEVTVEYDRSLSVSDMIALGHVIVWENLANIPDITTTALMAQGYSGETAADRFTRLCTEVGVTNSITGTASDTTAMGLQYEDYFQNQLTEIEATDMGMILETRSSLALTYRTRSNLYTQTAAVTVSVSANELAMPLEPVEDDAYTVNDVFAQRREGSSFNATKSTGTLSTLDPPNGVGRYKNEYQLNVQTDDQLEGVANWLLNQGTIDEARFPNIVVSRNNRHVVANPTLSAALMTADLGDRLVVSNASAQNFYDDISLLILGYTESMGNFEHTFSFNCVPASPYDVAKFGSAVGAGPDRYGTAGSQTNALVNTTATSLSVSPTDATYGNTLWTTVAGEFPFDINVGGERMTVTNITSATAPQTFTVTRSVNGVVKSQASGTAVRLWKTPRYGL